MEPRIASVFLDYKCNFWCDHCSVGSSPAINVPMSDEVFNAFFDQLEECPSINVVVFTGGECTLRLEKLLEGIKRVKKCGKIARIVTNGHWAVNEKKTREMFSLLCDAGLDEINTSFDTYHNAFVSSKTIANLVKIAYEIRMRVAVSILIDVNGSWNKDLVIAEIAKHNNWSFDECNSRVVFIDDSPTPVGSGDNENVANCAAGKSSDLGCANILKTISVHPDGSIKACCGHTMFYQKDLHIGFVQNEPLSEIVSRASKNLVYWYIHCVGPSALLAKYGHKEKYNSICHACKILFNEYSDDLVNSILGYSKYENVLNLLFSKNIKIAAGVISENKNLITQIMTKKAHV